MSQSMTLQSINFLHLTVYEIYPRQDVKVQGHYDKAKGKIKVTLGGCTPIAPIQCPTKYELSTYYTLIDIVCTTF